MQVQVHIQSIINPVCIHLGVLTLGHKLTSFNLSVEDRNAMLLERLLSKRFLIRVLLYPTIRCSNLLLTWVK